MRNVHYTDGMRRYAGHAGAECRPGVAQLEGAAARGGGGRAARACGARQASPRAQSIVAAPPLAGWPRAFIRSKVTV